MIENNDKSIVNLKLSEHNNASVPITSIDDPHLLGFIEITNDEEVIGKSSEKNYKIDNDTNKIVQKQSSKKYIYKSNWMLARTYRQQC